MGVAYLRGTFFHDLFGATHFTQLSRGTRLNFLDGWRGIAILLVLVGHFFPIPGFAMRRMGVEFFFVLSGRLMAQILFVDRFPLISFLKRRIARVWPALYVFVVLCSIIFAAAPDRLRVGWLDMICAFTFTTNYLSYFHDTSVVFEHLWSLGVEEWSYLLLTLIAVVHRRGIPPIPLLGLIGAMCVISGGIGYMSGDSSHDTYWRTDIRAASILIPAATFLLLRESPVPSWLSPAAALIGVALSIDLVPDPIKYSVGTFFFSIAVSTVDRSYSINLRMLSSGPLRIIGILSFSTYLWQQVYYKILTIYEPILGYAAHFILFSLAIITGAVSFYCIEQPMRKFLKEKWDKKN